jgi:hypothetical protein
LDGLLRLAFGPGVPFEELEQTGLRHLDERQRRERDL